ncbi:SMP-30/gluconolactonase/LRE family protein [Sphingomonas sp. PR090111-T3T-6A]|uniref:SMP-30/gluconolactonase/LRE family protein n=1 Tax=Sphingomonas sp. PR090111-T3T-6A TaxID=685778 RepID=UPI000376E0CC|nr:SMP-30/gluconolactonase/LRE family protein [Sphingomonas sp. PR090111-T3T-6A]
MSFSLDRRAFLASGAALLAAPALAQAVAPSIRRVSPKLDRIIAPDAKVEVIATNIKWAEGPVWVRQGGYLLFSDPPANIMRKWSRKGGVSVFMEPSGLPNPDPKIVREAGSNGMAMDHQGRLLIANSGGRSLDRYDLATRKRTVLVDRYKGKRFNSPNDMHVAKSGAIYFTDPPYGLLNGDDSPAKELPHNGVYRWTEGGEAVLLDGSLTRPNGIAMSPDEKRLYVSVSDEKARRIMVYDLDARGMPTGSRVFLDASAMPGPGNPDGMKVAADGTLFCSSPGGMWVLTPEGERLGVIEDGMPIANCAFGDDGSTLYMASSDRILRLPLKLNGWKA